MFPWHVIYPFQWMLHPFHYIISTGQRKVSLATAVFWPKMAGIERWNVRHLFCTHVQKTCQKRSPLRNKNVAETNQRTAGKKVKNFSRQNWQKCIHKRFESLGVTKWVSQLTTQLSSHTSIILATVESALWTVCPLFLLPSVVFLCLHNRKTLFSLRSYVGSFTTIGRSVSRSENLHTSQCTAQSVRCCQLVGNRLSAKLSTPKLSATEFFVRRQHHSDATTFHLLVSPYAVFMSPVSQQLFCPPPPLTANFPACFISNDKCFSTWGRVLYPFPPPFRLSHSLVYILNTFFTIQFKVFVTHFGAGGFSRGGGGGKNRPCSLGSPLAFLW